MPKKPRSARRRKNAINMQDADENEEGEVDLLSETHTIADESVFSDNQSFADFYGYGEDDDENVITEETIEKTVSNASLRNNKLLDSLSLVSSMSSEKRASRREQSLRSLFKAITQYATGTLGQETIVSRLEEVIIPACTISLRGGVATPAEQYASCRVLEATSVLLGGDEDEFTERVYNMLEKVVKATGRAVQVRCAALRAMSMATFVCSTDSTYTNQVLDLCENACAHSYRGENVAPSLRATALDCWALLSTTIHNAYIAGDEIDGLGNGRGVIILPLLNECLNHANLDLRCSAGECVALIHEARLNMGIDDDEGENASERRYRRGSWDGSNWEILMDDVKQRVAELSVESGHHMSKKAKKEQRATFRDFMATIVEDESPSEVISFRGGQILLTNWKEIIQLNFIRHCLQSGFQIQLLTNSTLQMIFGADGATLNSSGTMSQLEKRLLLSKTSETSKAADIERIKRRKSRTKAQNHFIFGDDNEL